MPSGADPWPATWHAADADYPIEVLGVLGASPDGRVYVSIVGSGTDEAPVDDHVTIFMTRDTVAAAARGISQHQLVALQSSLVVPGQTTFRMDASHAVATDGTQCGIEPPVMSFH